MSRRRSPLLRACGAAVGPLLPPHDHVVRRSRRRYTLLVRPLIVFTGQGLAYADGFELTERLRGLPALTDCFEVHGAQYPDDLDHVFSASGRAGDPAFDRLILATREMCIAERATALTRPVHSALFATLAGAARSRPVVHLTTNVDGLTSEVAVVGYGALWRPLLEPCDIDRLVLDVRNTLDSGKGLLHIPVHGEAGLLARGDGARSLWTQRSLTEPAGGYSTLYMGMGRGVINIKDSMIASQLGYRLLVGLLTESEVLLDSGHRIGPYPLADLVVIGYGARGSSPRCEYPFERDIAASIAMRRPMFQPTRTALVFERAVGDVVAWYSANDFRIVRHGDSDLVEQLQRSVLLQ